SRRRLRPRPPAPSPARLSATTPPGGVELQPGGGPVSLPITVRNDGGSASDPVTATLNLPAGISAVGPGGGGGAVGGGRADFSAQAAQGPLTVDCPAGTGTVTCSTSRGLRPGETAVLTFRLVADQNAQPGQVTGSVGAGSVMRVSINVPVTVRAVPKPDALSLQVDANWNTPWPWVHPTWLNIDARNDGPNTKPVTITVDRATHVVLGGYKVDCSVGGDTTTCTSRQPLPPQEHLRLWLEVDGHPTDRRSITVTATLGTATAAKTVNLDCAGPFCDGPEPSPPGLAPTTTTTPTTTTSGTTSPSGTSSSAGTPTTTTSTTTTTAAPPPPTTTTTTRNQTTTKPGRPWWWLPWVPW
ncbi:MAG TPA: RNA polymerase subunit sigma, partial [Amycolatopsis sp.]|nr:RNA polymerase subunit sigma [Amycolatopsis sp.]